jgi:hypothetical protein
MPEGGKFCGQCGAVNEPSGAAPAAPAPGPAPTAGAGNKVPLKTMMGFAPSFGPPGGDPTPLAPSTAPAVAQPQPVQPSQAPAPPAAAKLPMKTMLGFAPSAAAPMQAPPAASAAPPAPAPAAPEAPATSTAPKPGFQKTMLGGAGFAVPAQAAAAAAPTPSAAPQAPQGLPKGTMLGVAMPGIAPTHSSAPPQGTLAAPLSGPVIAPLASAAPGPVQAPQRKGAPLASTVALVAAPAPLSDMPPAPPPPRIVKSGGVSLAVVASVMGGVVLVGGVTTALLWRQPPPIGAQPKAAPDGKDVLHLTCDAASCKDGTLAILAGTPPLKTTFTGGQADLTLAEPLHIGDNELALQIERPGLGRDEAVKLVVPVAFRVHADIATMTSTHPSITIHAEALPGSDVKIDGKPVALDAKGTGSYVVDETSATTGPADESRAIAVDVPYVVTPKGVAAQNGTVSARVAVAPLRVDAPGLRGVFEEDRVLVAGRAAKGADITIDGSPVAVAADGSFETAVAVPALGDRTVDVRGGTSTLMPRTVHVALRRVKSLADEAKAFEAQKTIAYDAAMADLASATGQPIILEGEVFESRGSGHRTIILLANRRGCPGAACIVKVVVGREMKLSRGEIWRAYGTVTGGSPNAAGQTTLEMAADFLVRSKK